MPYKTFFAGALFCLVFWGSSFAAVRADEQRDPPKTIEVEVGVVAKTDPTISSRAPLTVPTSFDRYRGGLGILAILSIAFVISTNKKAISVRVMFWGLLLQLAFALVVLRTPWGALGLEAAATAVVKVLACSDAGAKFVFGEKLIDPGGPAGFVFAFRVLPTIIFVSALFAVLYYLRIMQVIVRAFAFVMARLMNASGAESLNVAASLFLGQTEAPLTIRPYLPRLTRSELLTVMTSGMAHVSGGVMGAYIGYGVSAKHILAAVVMTAPGTIMLSKMIIPETETPETLGKIRAHDDRPDSNILAAASRGAREGLQLALNIAAMLIAFVALVAFLNLLLSLVHTSMQQLLGWVLAPAAYLMGVPWNESEIVGGLLGTRTILNEMIAFGELKQLGESLSPRSFAITSFALCGFANLSSIGIQIGGIGALAPERRDDLAKLGLRALLAGTLANFLSACIAGLLIT